MFISGLAVAILDFQVLVCSYVNIKTSIAGPENTSAAVTISLVSFHDNNIGLYFRLPVWSFSILTRTF